MNTYSHCSEFAEKIKSLRKKVVFPKEKYPQIVLKARLNAAHEEKVFQFGSILKSNTSYTKLACIKQ